MSELNEIIEQVQRVLRIASCSSSDSDKHLGNREVVRSLLEWTQGKLESKVIPKAPDSVDETLFLWPKGCDFPETGGLALHTHLDTVPPGRLNDWTRSGPYQAQIHDAKEIVGLGAADVKSDAICKIKALLNFDDHRASIKRLPYFVGSFSEEVGMKGAKEIHDKAFVRPEWALVGEPSEGNLCYANKGFLSFEAEKRFSWEEVSSPQKPMVFQGQSAHSSSPHKGVNALEKALDHLIEKPSRPIGGASGSVAINVIPGYFEWQAGTKTIDSEARATLIRWRQIHARFQTWLSSLPGMDIFEPSQPTSTWTILEIEDGLLKIGLECRYLPNQNITELVDWLQQESGSEIQLSSTAPAAYQEKACEFGSALKKLLRPDQNWITKSGSNEAYFYQSLGAQVFVHGPGRSYGNIHKPNESIEIGELEKAFCFYRKVCEELCS
ncbi:MAG: M20/M25/M40 family metallo-hydrolase [Bradymonadales bacterium]|nr:MAG: M20/M25/M40 family metallo-hydrolase [Bradymonadales bacterium]